MDTCEYCGSNLKNSKYDSETNLFKKEKTSDKSWLCFTKWCSDKSAGDSDIVEITSADVPKYGQYNRRKTIQFDLDSNSNSNATNKTSAKGRQSILKHITNNDKVRIAV